jgi:hypothetical protein
MPKSLRLSLLIVAAVLGVLQLRLLAVIPDVLANNTGVTVGLYLASYLAAALAAIVGIVAAVLSNSQTLCRVLAGVSAVVAFGGIILAAIGDVINEYLTFFASIRFSTGLMNADAYTSASVKWILFAGLLAIILWAVCAIVPGSKNVDAGANSFAPPVNSQPQTFTAPQATQIPTSVATPAPVATKQFCSGCGAAVTGSGKFCSSCGASV